jgi:glycosyltransferase involved in cell wall biosynthesis
MFSVVIPLYNKAPHIAATLRSALAQSLAPDEIIVVDDGSTDGSGLVVESVADPRIVLVRQENAGVSAARNAGAQLARSAHIAFLDADDQWMPEHLATLRRLIDAFPDAGLYSTLYEIHLEQRVFFPRSAYPHGFMGIVDDFYGRMAVGLSLVNSTTACVAKAAFLETGGFPVAMKRGEDLVFWMKLARCWRVAHAAVNTAIYNRDAINRSNAFRERQAPGSLLYMQALILNGGMPPGEIESALKLFDSIGFFTAAGMRETGDFEGLAAIRALAWRMNRVWLVARLALLSVAPSRLLTFLRQFRHRRAQARPG